MSGPSEDSPELPAFLQGTEVHGQALHEELLGEMKALIARGEREEKRQRWGCAASILAFVISGVLMWMGRFWIMFGVDVVMLALYYYTSRLDPELADEPRLDFAIGLLEALTPGPVTLWMELNAYDMELADARTPLTHGNIESRWHQPWFRCEMVVEEQPILLEIAVDAVQENDGLRVVSSKERHTLKLTSEDISVCEVSSLIGSDVAEWIRLSIGSGC